MAGNSAYTEWYQNQYLKRFPKPPRKENKWTQQDLIDGFTMEKQTEYEMEYSFTLDSFVDFMMIQSNVNSKVESGEVPEEEAAWQALQKKRSSLLREPDDQKRKEKAVRFLSGHGFSAGAAFAVWERFQQEENENL